MKEEWNVVRVLRHYRHDWLNYIQLIKGNMELKKYDRVNEIIQEIISHTQNESRISNLHIPIFASEILIFNWLKTNHFQMELEVIGDTKDLSTFEEDLLEWFHTFVETLNACCEEFGENHVLLNIDNMADEYSCISFDFHGTLVDEKKIMTFIENTSYWNEHFKLEEFYINKEEFYIAIKLINED